MPITSDRSVRTERLSGIGAAETRSSGMLVRILNRLHQAACGMHGHDSLLQVERDRMFLRCASCGYQSAGWDVRRNAVPDGAEEARQAPLGLPGLGSRRIA